MAIERKKHVILGNVHYALSSSDNNCVSISIDFGKNTGLEEEIDKSDSIVKMKQPSKTVISRSRMTLSQRDTSQKQFTALKSRAPFFSVLKFESGAVIVVGLQDPTLTNLCVSKAVTDIADTLKYPIRIRNVSIVNTVSTFNRFHLNLIRIVEFINRHCIAYTYNPETFPGMFFKLRVPAKKLKEGETLGEYYTKAAIQRDGKNRSSFNIDEWLRVKTVLTFKVGKNTVLGECDGGDDVSVISKLLFGLFHYFMDHDIKLSPSEARRIRDRYGIPSLDWYLYVDMLFHSRPYIKPSKEEVRLSMIESTTSIDKTYYANSPDAPLSANLLPPGKETARIVNAMMAQKLCGPLTVRRKSVVALINQSRGWWRKSTRPDPFALLRVGRMSEAPAGTTNGKLAKPDGEWWLEKSFKKDKEHLIDLCHEEIVKECEDNNLIPAAFMRKFTLTDCQERLARVVSRTMDERPPKWLGNRDTTNYSLLGTNMPKKIKQNKKKHAVNLARLDTHMTAYRFLNTNLLSGLAPKFAELFGTDVYSLLHLVKNIPKVRGHSVHSQNRSTAYKTPGDAYFSHLFDEAAVNTDRVKKNNVVGYSAATLSQFKCEACGDALIKGSRSVERGLCETCDEQSTLYIESTLSNIRNNKKRPFEGEEELEEDDYCGETRKQFKYSPSDFIESVFKFKDELTGVPKVGLEFKVNDILNSLSVNRSMEDRPTANYRTSLHTDTQNKSNLNKLLVDALRESGATENEAHIFGCILKNGKGLDVLRELAGRGKSAK